LSSATRTLKFLCLPIQSENFDIFLIFFGDCDCDCDCDVDCDCDCDGGAVRQQERAEGEEEED